MRVRVASRMLLRMSAPQLLAIAFAAGAAISCQAAANARLGVLLKSPGNATAVAFLSALGATLVGLLLVGARPPTAETATAVPRHLWVLGGLLSAASVAAFYWLIPQLGIGPVIACGLAGQLAFAITAGHFGWFGLPVQRIGPASVTGVLFLVAGVLLTQRGAR